MSKTKVKYDLIQMVDWRRNQFSIEIDGFYGDLDASSSFTIDFTNARWLPVFETLIQQVDEAQKKEAYTDKTFLELLPKRYQRLWYHIDMDDCWEYNPLFQQYLRIETYNIFYYDENGTKFVVRNIITE